ncbi:type I-D CRISPR-associated protein Cas5/Csc1 [Nostoc sp.]|uniref:type I-D CRISPR-associated protein Cas5/Csc1 n=1 Tax=unclassified Nostoc TaxID=2593658 RepID=UPI003FA5D903
MRRSALQQYPLSVRQINNSNQVISYDVVNMPPISLIQNIQMRGQYYQFDGIQNLKIPLRMEYHFRS